MKRLLVETEIFKLFVSRIQKCAARCFVNAAALHAHKSVLHDIFNSDAVCCSKLVCFLEKLCRAVVLDSVNCNRNTLFKFNFNICGFVGCLFGGNHEF